MPPYKNFMNRSQWKLGLRLGMFIYLGSNRWVACTNRKVGSFAIASRATMRLGTAVRANNAALRVSTPWLLALQVTATDRVVAVARLEPD